MLNFMDIKCIKGHFFNLSCPLLFQSGFVPLPIKQRVTLIAYKTKSCIIMMSVQKTVCTDNKIACADTFLLTIFQSILGLIWTNRICLYSVIQILIRV